MGSTNIYNLCTAMTTPYLKRLYDALDDESTPFEMVVRRLHKGRYDIVSHCEIEHGKHFADLLHLIETTPL